MAKTREDVGVAATADGVAPGSPAAPSRPAGPTSKRPGRAGHPRPQGGELRFARGLLAALVLAAAFWTVVALVARSWPASDGVEAGAVRVAVEEQGEVVPEMRPGTMPEAGPGLAPGPTARAPAAAP